MHSEANQVLWSLVQAAPFYQGSCSPVPCPENTTGVDLKQGCRCGEGYRGLVKAIAEAPYYRPGLTGFRLMLASKQGHLRGYGREMSAGTKLRSHVGVVL